MDFIRLQRLHTNWNRMKGLKSIRAICGLSVAIYGLYVYSYINTSWKYELAKSRNFKHEGRSIVTMFSTWPKPEYPEKYDVRNNTVANWKKFQEYFTPIYFTNEENLKNDVQKGGWKTLPLKLENGNDLPVLKNMYIDALKYYDSWFYCLASGDILFTDGLIKTLLALMKLPGFRDKVILLIGQRTNVVNVTRDEATDFEILEKISKERGELFKPDGVDYYITSKNFPWEEMPKVVFGRRAMDNFLVMESLYRNYIVIETTKTILAVHHTSIGGNLENFGKANTNYNIPLIQRYYGRKSYDFSKGLTICGNYFSQTLNNGTIIFNKRHKSPCF